MDARQFVANWKIEKSNILERLNQPDSLAGQQLAALALSEQQAQQLELALDTLLTDVMYSLLLGLDGCAEIGGEQQAYSITDEEGNLLTDLESEAYEQFHGAA